MSPVLVPVLLVLAARQPAVDRDGPILVLRPRAKATYASERESALITAAFKLSGTIILGKPPMC